MEKNQEKRNKISAFCKEITIFLLFLSPSVMSCAHAHSHTLLDATRENTCASVQRTTGNKKANKLFSLQLLDKKLDENASFFQLFSLFHFFV